MNSERQFSQRAIYKPRYLEDNKENARIRKSLMKDINKGGGGGPLYQIEQSQERRCLSTETYIPVKDQNRIYEFNQIEKRFKLQFRKNKMGYTNKYLSQFSDLLTNKNCKDYLTQRKQMIEKYQPLSSLVSLKNNKGTFYLTENQKTIQSQRAIKQKSPPSKKFVYLPITRNKRFPIDNNNTISRTSNFQSLGETVNTHYENEKAEVEFLEPRDDNIKNFYEFPEREEVEKNLKASYNFIESDKSKTKTFVLKKMFNPGNVLSYFKNNNPRKIEYVNKLLMTYKKLPDGLSEEILPLLKGAQSLRHSRRKSVPLFKTS